jgi:hypothetical protein
MSTATMFDDGDENFDAYLARSARRDCKTQRGIDDNQASQAHRTVRAKVMRLNRGNTNPASKKLK